MRLSKYVNLDANILMEYIYDDSNLISEPYEILVNTKDSKNSFLSTTSGSLNTISNNLFPIDSITRTYGITDVSNYSFLQVNNYSTGFPLRYDTIIIHLPISYTFGNNIGFYLRVYAFDFNNLKQYDLCNFFYDVTNVNTKSYINYTNPPFIYNETLWGKELTISIPSVYALSNQRTSNITTENSVNFNLTQGIGLNQQTPIFIEFSFINTSQTINGIKTYKLGGPLLTNIPQLPEFQQVGVVIQPADDGDFFEIYGIFDGTIAGFNEWINNSIYLGNRYYVVYTITMYEQNIRGNSLKITVTDNFNTPIEFRPIIKYSSTTAIIQVEMNIIDAVDNSTIVRKASYGMLPNQVSKFSRYLSKINLSNATKPKIYNTRNNNGNSNYQVSPVTSVQTVSIPYSVLVESANVVAQSDNVVAGSKLYYGEGKLLIILKPFDTYVKINLYNSRASGASASAADLAPYDLTSYGTIKISFKNAQSQYDFPLYTNNSDLDISKGIVTFLIPASSVSNLRTIANSGTNVFYITSTQQNSTSVIYSGLFDMYDSVTNINNLLQSAINQIAAASTPVQLNVRDLKDKNEMFVSVPAKVATIDKEMLQNSYVLNNTITNSIEDQKTRNNTISSQDQKTRNNITATAPATTPSNVPTISSFNYAGGTYNLWYTDTTLTIQNVSSKIVKSYTLQEVTDAYNKEGGTGKIVGSKIVMYLRTSDSKWLLSPDGNINNGQMLFDSTNKDGSIYAYGLLHYITLPSGIYNPGGAGGGGGVSNNKNANQAVRGTGTR